MTNENISLWKRFLFMLGSIPCTIIYFPYGMYVSYTTRDEDILHYGFELSLISGMYLEVEILRLLGLVI